MGNTGLNSRMPKAIGKMIVMDFPHNSTPFQIRMPVPFGIVMNRTQSTPSSPTLSNPTNKLLPLEMLLGWRGPET
jgi:hypothetical protein